MVFRSILTLGVLLAVVPVAAAQPSPTITIANFNIRVFGTKKTSDTRVMTILSRIARRFDVMAVEEFRDATGQTPQVYLDWINRDTTVRYAMVVGPPAGRSNSKEQYAIYYRTNRVRFVDSFTVPDPRDRFERPPLVARFVAGKFDFRLVVSHIRPAAAVAEMAALASVAVAVQDSAERDVILLGDFNADCTYFHENDNSHPLRNARFHWVIGDETQTAVSTNCTYDRIVLMDGTWGHELVPNSGRAFRYDSLFRVPKALVPLVSDHFPVFAEYRVGGPDDDGSAVGPPVAQGFVARRTGGLYYKVGCEAARRIPVAEVVRFGTERAARAAGYARSGAEGC